MGELLPPALWGQGGRESVSGGLQLPTDILADRARLHRPGIGGNRQAAPGNSSANAAISTHTGSEERLCVHTESVMLSLPDCV